MSRPGLFSTATAFGGAALAGMGSLAKGIISRRDGGAIVRGVSRARTVASDEILPEKVDVVVIGGGYIGTVTALVLAERGVRVALCEKGVIGGESSGRSLGLIEGQMLDPAKLGMVLRSKELWRGMNDRIAGETGYRRTGMAALIADDGFLGFVEAWVASMKGLDGVDARMMTAAEANAVAHGGSERYIGGLYQASDGAAEPELAAPAIAEGARKAGGLVFQHCAVRGIDTHGGRVSAVVTERGVIACSSVVLAGGAWSPLFLRSLGVKLPQFMAFSSIARLKSEVELPTPLLEGKHGVVLRRGLSGDIDLCKARGSAPIMPSLLRNFASLGPAMKHLGSQIEPVWNLSTFMSEWRIPRRWSLDTVSPFEANRILMPETRAGLIDDVLADARKSFPSLRQSVLKESWAGVLTSTPDNMPVISAVDRVPGLFVGSGFYFGLTMAPAAGEALADLVTGNDPKVDLSAYRLSRFSDGSDVVFRH